MMGPQGMAGVGKGVDGCTGRVQVAEGRDTLEGSALGSCPAAARQRPQPPASHPQVPQGRVYYIVPGVCI